MTTPKKKATKPNAELKAAIDKLNRTPATPTKAAQSAADLRKIKILVKENPYRKDSKAAKTFDLLIKSPTVDAFMQSVDKNPTAYDRGYLRYAWRDSYIEIKE